MQQFLGFLETQEGRGFSRIPSPAGSSVLEFPGNAAAAAPGSEGVRREFVPKTRERAQILLDLLFPMSQGAAPGESSGSKGNLLHSQPLESGRGWKCPSHGSGSLGFLQEAPWIPPKIPAAAFPPSQGSRGIFLQEFGAAPTFSLWIHNFLPSFPAFPRTLLLLSPGRFGCLIPNSGAAGLFPGVIPRGFFHAPGSICSSPARIKALPRSTRIFPKNSPFSLPPSLPSQLEIPKAGWEKSSF